MDKITRIYLLSEKKKEFYTGVCAENTDDKQPVIDLISEKDTFNLRFYHPAKENSPIEEFKKYHIKGYRFNKKVLFNFLPVFERYFSCLINTIIGKDCEDNSSENHKNYVDLRNHHKNETTEVNQVKDDKKDVINPTINENVIHSDIPTNNSALV